MDWNIWNPKTLKEIKQEAISLGIPGRSNISSTNRTEWIEKIKDVHLGKIEIKKKEKVKKEDQPYTLECCICLEITVREKEKLKCNHCVCKDCMGKMVNEKCPLCRGIMEGILVKKTKGERKKSLRRYNNPFSNVIESNHNDSSGSSSNYSINERYIEGLRSFQEGRSDRVIITPDIYLMLQEATREGILEETLRAMFN